MTLEEQVEYIHKNHLEHDITNAMMNNHFGFAILPSIGHFFITDDGVYYNCKTVDGDTDILFLTKKQFDEAAPMEKERITNSIQDPGHCSVDILKEKENYSILNMYQKNSTQEERRKQLIELEIKEFLFFTKTKNSIGIRSLINQANEIVKNWKPNVF